MAGPARTDLDISLAFCPRSTLVRQCWLWNFKRAPKRSPFGSYARACIQASIQADSLLWSPSKSQELVASIFFLVVLDRSNGISRCQLEPSVDASEDPSMETAVFEALLDQSRD
ncbi:hypothetical protein PG994_009828 [Apiospora phragmitis]|uniref:Uncharacterized protein n=1 Tax=Apiospora phragmitis TaxID=2905665 RepID=A0ABR1U768_9PEZI